MAAKNQKTVGELQRELLPGLSSIVKGEQRNIPIEQARKKRFKKPPKAKRSYMLREDTIQMLEDAKRMHKGASLSDVITLAIIEYYQNHKAEIQDTFNTD